jgi:hypothetical protein
MILIRNITIAITSKMCMKFPRTLNPKNPINQRITRIVAIVVSIMFFYF